MNRSIAQLRPGDLVLESDREVYDMEGYETFRLVRIISMDKYRNPVLENGVILEIHLLSHSQDINIFQNYGKSWWVFEEGMRALWAYLMDESLETTKMVQLMGLARNLENEYNEKSKRP